MTGQGKGYALPNDWELADRRLELLEASHDQTSIRRAELLGVGRGWHCLDAGAGGGSFSRWLAGRVGGEGRVVAADQDIAVLERRAIPGVEVRRMDLVADELPHAAFDFVHTRLVLLHVPERERVLPKLVSALRPGGVLMLEEDDVFSIPATSDRAYRDGWKAFLATMEGAGVDGRWARRLPERLDELGLAEVGAEVDTQLFRGGSDPARFWSLTWLQVRERIIASGTPERVVDEGRAALEDPRLWFYGPAKVIAWGRRC
jgi:SAM-dependent methyltransferase